MAKYIIKNEKGKFIGENKLVSNFEKAKIFNSQKEFKLIEGDTLIEVRLALVREVKSK